ncbi:MAG TPA: hypothetical protein VKA91_03485, partial [Nitrososphaeraceae archaeon]|nr:hypothetical protein [Nitrososphaeraceae archaeon]
ISAAFDHQQTWNRNNLIYFIPLLPPFLFIMLRPLRKLTKIQRPNTEMRSYGNGSRKTRIRPMLI